MSVEDKRTQMEKIIGSTLLQKVNTKKKTADILKDKDLVLLYFSASWCPPCKQFSPLLADFYKKFATKEKFEIVFVSSDRSVEAFNEYYATMPWLAIPTDIGAAQLKNRLAQQLNISSIPTLVVLECKTGKFVSDNARNNVMNVVGDDEKAVAVVKAWKAIEPVNLEDAVSTREEPRTLAGTIMTWFMFILKNPVYIFGLLYLYKTYLKNTSLKAIFSGGGAGDADAASASTGTTDQEF